LVQKSIFLFYLSSVPLQIRRRKDVTGHRGPGHRRGLKKKHGGRSRIVYNQEENNFYQISEVYYDKYTIVR